MDSWFGSVADDDRFCFTSVARLKAALRNPRVVDAVLIDVGPPGKSDAALKKLPKVEKLELIEQEIEYRLKAKQSLWKGTDFLEALAGEMFLAESLPTTLKREIWHSVAKENALLRPVAEYLKAEGFETYAEVKMGRNRIDVLGHQKKQLLGLIPERFVGVELKNSLAQNKRGLDQLVAFADFTHTTWLACTPWFGAEYLAWFAKADAVHHWDPEALQKKLARAGMGLLVVEPDGVRVIVPAKDASVGATKIAELRKHMTPKNAV